MRPVTLLLLFAVSAPVAAQTPVRYDSTLFNALRWREIGPFRGGRSTAVAGHADQPYVYYLGATGGGVWKTTDGGMNWSAVSDSAFRSGSIGAITVAPSDPNVVYVGTGETPLRGNASPGDGMYKSTDAGKSWTHTGLRDAGQIGAIHVHPTNPDLVYVAVLGHAFGPSATRGVFRSKDGGKTWDKILFRSDSAGAVDLAMDPSNPRIIYAAFWQAQRGPWFLSSGGTGSGLWKTTDGGDTWADLSRNEGMPKGTLGKIGVTVSHANPERVWALIEAEEGGVYRSDDAGKTWRRLNEDRALRQRAWYYTHIHADPRDPETVYVLNVGFWKSVDGGRTFVQAIRPPHGDNHALWIAPNDPERMINGNDGGGNVSFNGGRTWTAQDQATAQFYHVTTTNHFPYQVCGAQQDNSTICGPHRTSGGGITWNDWYEVGGCESGYIAVRPDEPDVSFAGCYGGYLGRFDRKTGQERNVSVWPDNPMGWGAADLRYRFNWTYPIIIAPHNPRVLYTSANVVFKSSNEGQSWEPISGDLTRNDKAKQGPSGGPITKDNTSIEYYNVVFAVAPSPHDSNTVWAGTDDGLIHVTRDGGKNWSNVTPRDLPEALISIIEPSPHDPATAYVAATRYKLDDFRPYLYKTTDYGRSWRRVVTGIPEGHFVRVIRADPTRRGLLYAAGEFGVYVSFDDGGNWQSLRLNLPVVPIHDLAVKDHDLIAGTHGRSFWVLDDLTPLHQLTEAVARAPRFLYKPRDVWRMQGGFGGGGGGGGGGRVEGIGQNPPGGAVVYFYLAQKPEGEVALEVLDARDSLIRRFSTRPAAGGDSLRVDQGMNRFVWNLRYPEATRFPGMIFWSGGTQGPVAVPGTYKVRVRVGDWSETRAFEVKKDPRVMTAQQDLQAQFDFLIRIRDRVSAANDAVRRIRELKEQIKVASDRARQLASGGERTANGSAGSADVVRQADSLTSRLSAIESEIYQVRNRSNQDPLNYPIRLNNKLAALTGVVASADAKPTDQSLRVFDELSSALQVQLDRLKAVVDTEVPAFNRLVREREIPAVGR